jgi:hypothetical protein
MRRIRPAIGAKHPAVNPGFKDEAGAGYRPIF